jgi:O-antigen/teichoic acid export membrane protein
MAPAGLRVAFARSPHRADFGVFWSFSVPAVLATALLAPASWLVSALLARQPSGYAELGLFNAAYQWRSAILFAPNAFLANAVPILSSLRSDRGRQAFGQAVWSTLLANIAVGSILALVVVALAPRILGLYGPEFVRGRVVLQLVAVVAVLDAFTNVIAHALISIGAVWRHFWILLIWSTSLVLAAMALVPLRLATGLAAAYLAAQCLYAVALLPVARRLLGRAILPGESAFEVEARKG